MAEWRPSEDELKTLRSEHLKMEENRIIDALRSLRNRCLQRVRSEYAKFGQMPPNYVCSEELQVSESCCNRFPYSLAAIERLRSKGQLQDVTTRSVSRIEPNDYGYINKKWKPTEYVEVTITKL